jgi:predicted DNA-binding ribbon-helix-helix protein
MKKVTISVMGEKFEIELEDEFFEFVKDDLAKVQKMTPKELLVFVLEKNKREFELTKRVEKILSILEKE